MLNYCNILHLAIGSSKFYVQDVSKDKTSDKATVIWRVTTKGGQRKIYRVKLKTKNVVDQKKKMGDKSVELGDQVLIKQTKSTTKPPFNPSPYKIVKVSRNSATLERY